MNSKLNLLTRHFLFFSKTNLVDLVWDLFIFAHKARKEGLLSLESEIKHQKKPLLVNGLKFLCGGTEPEVMKQILENQKAQEFLLLQEEADLIFLAYIQSLHSPQLLQSRWLPLASNYKGTKLKAFQAFLDYLEQKHPLLPSLGKPTDTLPLLLDLCDQGLSIEEFRTPFDFLVQTSLNRNSRTQNIITLGLDGISQAWHPRDILLSLEVNLQEDEQKALHRKIMTWEKKNESSFRSNDQQAIKEAKPKDLKDLAMGHLAYLNSEDITLILKEIPISELAIALSSANVQTRMLFFEQLTDRARSMIIEEIETMKEPTSLESQEAQSVILEITRRLIAEGAIQW